MKLKAIIRTSLVHRAGQLQGGAAVQLTSALGILVHYIFILTWFISSNNSVRKVTWNYHPLCWQTEAQRAE